MARKFFDHQQFNFEFQFALGGVHYGAGDLGEMLSTADRIVDGDADSWCQEWIATGRRVAALAEECEQSAYRVSARAAYLRRSSPDRPARSLRRRSKADRAVRHQPGRLLGTPRSQKPT
jgi:hypothetical protein